MNRMSPLVIGDVVVQANAIDGLSTFDRKSGSLLWRLDLKNGVEGGVQSIGERLYFGSSDGFFYCVALANGKTIWSAPANAETLAPPTVESGVVYFQTGADIVFALDAETGKQLWQYNRQVTTSLSIRASTRPVIAGENLLVGFSDGVLVSLRKRDGGLLWERKLGRGSRFRDVDATPVVDGATVYVSSFDAALYSLKLETGEVNWSVEDGGYVPVTLGRDQLADRLFYATATGKIVALDKHTGKKLLTIPVRHGIATQPVIYKGFLVYGESEGALVVADATGGQAVGRFAPGEGLVSKPEVLESTGDVYFISSGANLFSMKMGYRFASDTLPWQMAR
jgi:outer membrane protein assembly factor BamB